MIPTINELYSYNIVTKQIPSKNYKMFFDKNNIKGFRDNKDAIRQVIYKILNTERYQYKIYSWNYGVELAKLFGKDVVYVCSQLESTIKDALMQDDRINDVLEFEFDISKRHTVSVSFLVKTIFGEMSMQWNVEY